MWINSIVEATSVYERFGMSVKVKEQVVEWKKWSNAASSDG